MSFKFYCIAVFKFSKMNIFTDKTKILKEYMKPNS